MDTLGEMLEDAGYNIQTSSDGKTLYIMGYMGFDEGQIEEILNIKRVHFSSTMVLTRLNIIPDGPWHALIKITEE